MRTNARTALSLLLAGLAITNVTSGQEYSKDYKYLEGQYGENEFSDKVYSDGEYGREEYGADEYANDSYQDEYNPSRPYRSSIGRKLGYAPEYVKGGSYRQPTCIAVLDNKQALIATKLTGQIFWLDTQTWHTNEALRAPGAEWVDLCKINDTLIAATDPGNDQVALLRRVGNELQILERLDAPGHPNKLAWDSSANKLLASSRWSRRVYQWQIEDAEKPSNETSPRIETLPPADLPLCGGEIVSLPKKDLVLVVDDFGRDFALLSRNDLSLVKHGQLYGHNITGLAATPDQDMVYFPHQLLNEYAQSVVNDITWGGLMSNNLRWLQVDRLLNYDGHDMFKKGRFYPLGTPGNGAGDPSSMAVSSTGRVAVTLAGTNRAAIGKEGDYYFKQVDVGMRPIDCAYSADDKHLIVVNQFSDSLSIVALDDMSVQHVSLGPTRPPTLLERGEHAFFDSRLAHDGWMSCHSCHSEGHTNGQLNDNFTDKSYGTPKRILTLLGQSQTLPYAWSGEINSLELQVKHSIESTMAHGQPANRETVHGIAAFVRSLQAPPSVHEARWSTDPAIAAATAEQNDNSRPSKTLVADSAAWTHKGKELFRNLNCADCHSGSRFTTTGAFDVGLRDEEAMKLFNPPSLVAVSQRQNSLLHDGRAQSIEDVIAKEKHQLPRQLTEEEVGQLVAFLESL